MTPADLAIITGQLGPLIKRYVAQELAPLLAHNKALELRVLELETRPEPVRPERGDRGEPGIKGDTGVGVSGLVITSDHRLMAHFSDGRMQDVGPVPIGPAGASGKDGLNGKDADPVDVDAIIARVAALIPTPRDGQDGAPGAPGLNGQDGAAGLDGAPGLNGKDGSNGLDGKDGAPGADGRDGLNGKDGAAGLDGASGRDGLNGKDGVGVVDAVLDRAGHLIMTFSDGRTKDLGIVIGRDGLDGTNGKDGVGTAGAAGRDGRDVDMDEVKTLVLSELSTWARPKDGRDGIDGKDGLGFDDFDMTFDPTRGVVLQMRQGERVKEFVCPQPFFVPDWGPGQVLPKGACVQYDGGFWTALRETSTAPAENHDDWRLLVRRGKQGKTGRDGKDFTPPRSNTPPLYG